MNKEIPWRLLVGMGVVTLLIRALTAFPLQGVGYFDAAYYLHVAQNMVAGRGMVEDVIWNYLDQSPVAMQVPRPSHLYWMPMTTWVAWVGLLGFERVVGPLQAAFLPFMVLSSFLPPLSGWIAWRLWARRDFALAAGVLTIFSGFYFLYWVVPDSYTPFALTVSLALLGCWLGERGRAWGWGLAGIGAGLSHLTRADGSLLVLVIAFLALTWAWHTPDGVTRWRRLLLAGGLSGAAYLLIMGPWLARNLALTGTILPGGGVKTVWLREYNEIFSYGIPLTAERFLTWGIWPIVRSKLLGLLWTGAVLIGAFQLFLVPFIGLGWQQARASSEVRLLRPLLVYTLVLIGVMALGFTFPARHGSVLHSAAALVPWLSALIPAGIEKGARAFARWRRLDGDQAWRVLGSGFVGLAILITMWIYAQAFLPPAPNAILPPWNRRYELYQAVGTWLDAQGSDGLVLAHDPPGFTFTTGRPAIMVPSDGIESLNEVASRFQARWLVAERHSAAPYQGLLEDAPVFPGWVVVADFVDPLGHPARLFQRVAP